MRGEFNQWRIAAELDVRTWTALRGMLTMFEENQTPLPPGDMPEVFSDVFAEMRRHCDLTPPKPLAPDNVLQWGRSELRPYLARICGRLLLPGSRIAGLENLVELTRLATDGASCILCLNHRSNLDVPTLDVLLTALNRQDIFRRLIWIAGRKLQEDVGLTAVFVQAFNRVTVTPKSWLDSEHSKEELAEAHRINLAALRAIHEFRQQGWVFALFPAGTRTRPGRPTTSQAIEETDGYLKSFDYMALCHIDGCTLPVTRKSDLTHESPTLDTICYTIGGIQRTDAWRQQAADRFPLLDPRAASARAIMEDIASLQGA